MEGSRAIYKPIRVSFDTPVYNTAVKICWHLRGYGTHIAIMREFLRLQRENQIPSHITAEDMIDLLVQDSTKTLREQLRKFKLEDFEEDEVKPLLKLVWAVNIINKKRDIELQARALRKFPEAIPPKFRTPKLLTMVSKYIEIFTEKQQEVVIEVVPQAQPCLHV